MADDGRRAKAQQLLGEVCQRILAPFSLEEAAARATAAFSADHQSNTVVVVGEVSRGKSSLVGALVGWEELGTGTGTAGATFGATALPVAVGPVTEAVPAGQAALTSSTGITLVSAAELPRWVGRGQQDTTTADGDVPTRAYLAVEDSGMGDAVVVDMPGIGGIGSSIRSVHPDSEHQASVTIVTTDASAQLTRPEMEFLRAAGATNDSVLVVVTKTDKHLTRWRTIVEKNRELIREHVGRDIPVLPVSSILAFDAETYHLSGVQELREAVAKRFRQAGNLPAINGLRIAAEALRDLDAHIAKDIEATRGAEATVPELEEEVARLEELTRQTERWAQYLSRDLALAKLDAVGQLDQELKALRAKWEEFVAQQGFKVLRKDPKYFTQLFEADYQAAVAAATQAYTDRLGSVVAARFESEALQREVREEVAGQLRLRHFEAAELRDKKRDVFDPMMLMMGTSSGSMAGTAALGAGLAFAPAALAVGIGWIGINMGFRAMKQGKAQLTQWLQQTDAAARSYTSRALENINAVAQPAIAIAYRDQLKREIEETKSRLAQAQQAARMEEQKREKRIARQENNRKIVQLKLRELDAAVEELRR